MQKNTLKRLDAHLSSLGYCSRKEAKKFLRLYRVCVKGEEVFNPAIKAYHSDITIDGEPLDPETLTLLMHKPKDVICSHDDAGVLIYSLLPERWLHRNPKLSTVGRLDVDTTGAILITDDGVFNHKLTSPKSEAIKVYEATLAEPLKGNEAELFASGTLMLNNETKPLLPAKLIVLSPTLVQLEICEGRYHQVKRMFAATRNKVINLHRLNFAGYTLDNLNVGEYKIIE